MENSNPINQNPFNFRGCQFATFTYTNSYGEVSNYKVLLGASYENAQMKDLATLKNTNFSEQNLEIARLSIMNAILSNMNDKTRSNQSKAKKEAYTNLGKGVRLHNDSGEIKVMAYLIKKHQTESQKLETIINQNSGLFKERKVINSKQETNDKNEVKKLLKLRETKIVQFSFNSNQLEKAKINGKTIEI